MLVRAFQVQVGRKRRLLGMRAAQHGLVRRAGIEPDVERVAVLHIHVGIFTEQVFRIQCMPGGDAAFLDKLGDRFQQFRRARMQLAGFLVQEKSHWHAPLALARQRPVGTVRNHAMQARLAPVRIKRGRFNGR